MTNSQKLWAAIYFIALAAILALFYMPYADSKQNAERPDESSCQPVNGWSAKISSLPSRVGPA